MPNRRRFLQGGLAAAALAAVPARAQDNPWAAMVEQYERVRPSSFTRALVIPRVLKPRATDGGEDLYEMTVKPGLAQPLDGRPTPVVGFDGAWPGPTIRATKGRPVRLRIQNGHDRNISIHNHGHSCPAESDGHPIAYVKPGAMREHAYPNKQSAGTYWLHDHAMGLAGEHVYRGMSSLYLIHDPEEDALGLPRGGHDVPIVLQDRLFDDQNALSYTVDAGSIFNGHLGNTLCVNGVFTPYFQVATRKYRLRFVNAANARTFRLAMGDGRKLVQIASDGALLAAPVARPFIDVSPSERCDCIVDFSDVPVGTSIVLRNIDATYPAVPEALRFDVVRKERDDSKIPARLATVPRLDEASATVHRDVRMQIDDGKWTLNGLHYDPARIDFKPRLGTTEVWTLFNAESTQTHPFHQHLVQFQVLDIDGAAPPAHLRGWKDTVLVGPGAKVRIIMRFTGYTGVYVFHCHKLEHEDHAMMLQQEVVA